MAAKSYTEAQLKNMSVNPAVPGIITDAYPDLIPLIHDSELPEQVDSNAFLRFVAYVYDPESPLIVKHKDIRARKRAAEELTGFPAKEEHAQTIVGYLKRVNSMEWTLVASLERMFEEVTELINAPINTDGVKDEDILKAVERKTKLKEEMKKLPGEIRDAKREFFGDNELLEKAAKSVARTPEARQMQ